MLIAFKEPLLNSLKIESNVSILRPLCEMIGLVAARLYQFPIGGWLELLQYVCDCFSGTKLNLMKALIMLAELPEEAVSYYNDICSNLLKFVDSPDQELRELMFNASLIVIKMSRNLGRTEVCDYLLTVLLRLIDVQYGGEDVLDMVKLKRLGDLVTLQCQASQGDVFWCMLRVAEREDASNELKCVAVSVINKVDEVNSDAMESVLKKFCDVEMRRVISVAMDMMSCVVDDPVWHDIDNKICEDAGLTENYNRGKFLLNLLSFDGNERVFVPTAIEMMEKKYAFHSDWRVRYAAMLTIAAIAERNFKGDMIWHIDRAVILVQKSLYDRKHQVLWATMHAIKCLSEYKERLKFCNYHLKFLAKLTGILKINLCSRVQASAVIAIRFLVTNCGLEKINSSGEDIVALLLVLLKHEKQKLQEQVVETLKSVAVQMPVTFYQNYFDKTMAALRVILFDNSSSPSLLLRAKCVECIALPIPKLLPLILEKDKINVTLRITVSLSEALGKETDNDLSKRMFRLLPKCIKASGLIANRQLIRIILDGINQALKKIMENEIKRVEEAGTSEEEGDFLPTQETIEDAGSLIATITETFNNRLSIYIDCLMNNVVLFFETKMPDRVIVFAISIFNILVPQFPEKLTPHHNKYIGAACHALRNNIPHSQPHATRAIGICAEFGKDHFNPVHATEAVSRLCDVAMHRFPISEKSGDVAGCDSAVDALGKICEYHRGKIEGSTVVRNWLHFLPLKHDFHAARSAHELLSRLIRSSDADLFGTANVNLPKIISVVREILSEPDLLSDLEAIQRMNEFINQFDGM